MSTVSTSPDLGSVDFLALSPDEQRAVASRLLKMQQSDWKPFWCKDAECGGSPHPQVDTNGAMTYVSDSTISGPMGQPVGELYSDEITGDSYVIPDRKDVEDYHTLLGRVLLDPLWSHNHARVDQRLLDWNKPWTLYLSSGRGTGKTTTGVEFVTLCARKGLDGAIIGRRGTELVNTHVAEIMKRAHPDFVPIYWASKDLIEWPNGALTYLFSAEKPDNIRSVNLSYGWVDEAAFMDEIATAWMNLKFATRVKSPGNPIHFLITSTPTPTKWVMEMEDDEGVTMRRVSTYANKANLDADFLADLRKKYEGTRTGRQELHGEVLRDVVGALWNDDIFNHHAVTDGVDFISLCESMDDIVVAVDPAGTANKRSDETGIIAVGVQHTDSNGDALDASRFYVLADGTIKGSPTEWARRVYHVAYLTRAHRIIAEKNFGADMVLQTLRDFAKTHPGEAVTVHGDDMADLLSETHATQNKETRAEATVGKYEQGRVFHVPNPTIYGDLSVLEKEQTTWVPKGRGGKSPSPNRIDALVWAMRALEAAVRFKGQMAGAKSILDQIKPRAYSPLTSLPGQFGSGPQSAPVMPAARTALIPAAPTAPKAPVRYSVAKDTVYPAKPRRPAGVHKR